jgi:hypothetical protein
MADTLDVKLAELRLIDGPVAIYVDALKNSFDVPF